MATIPGLTPVGYRSGDRRRMAGRLDAPDASAIRPTSLTPVASPVDTVARPAEAPIDNNLRSLSESLALLNPELTRFLESKEPDPDDARAAAMRVVQTTDPAELDARMKGEGVPEFANMHGQQVWGERKAYLDSTELIRRYNEEFDKEGGDVNALFREVTAEAFERYGKDRTFLETYTAVMDKTWNTLTSSHQEYKTSEEMTRRKDDVFGAWHGRVDFMISEGKPPAEIVESIFKDIPDNRDFLRLHPKEQQEMLLQIADQQATKGNYDFAKAMLTMERKDGPYKGSLMSDREFADRATTLYQRIENDQIKQRLAETAAEAEEQVYEMAGQMVSNGTILSVTDATIPDKNGEMRTIPADEILKQTALREQARVQEEAATRGMTKEQATVLEKERFINSGLEHPTWFTMMNGAYTQVTSSTTTGETLPPTAVESLRLYRDLNKDSPNYLGKHMTEKAVEFYDVASYMLDAGLAASEEEALKKAQYVSMTIDSNDPALRQRYEDVDRAVDRVIGGSSGFFSRNLLGGPAQAANYSQVRNEITRAAKAFARAGMNPKDALAKAQETFTKTHVNVAGGFVRADKRMPPDFSSMVDVYLNDFVTKHGDTEDVELSDLIIVDGTNGTGGYLIVNRSTMMPVVVDDNSHAFTFSTLDALRASRREAAMQEVVTNANE